MLSFHLMTGEFTAPAFSSFPASRGVTSGVRVWSSLPAVDAGGLFDMTPWSGVISSMGWSAPLSSSSTIAA